MRKRPLVMLGAGLLVALTAISGPTSASGALAAAAPAKPVPANLKTVDPTTACVRGAARPYIADVSPRLHAFVPTSGTGAQARVDFRIASLATGLTLYAGQSYTKSTGTWFEPQVKPVLRHGRVYVWRARVFDGTFSPWSDGCELAVDTVRPNAPGLTVSPPEPYYVGKEITLTFTNAGSGDVAKYGYAVSDDVPQHTVPASPGTATAILTSFGPTTITAWSYDHADNPSPPTTVRINVTS